jgi:hypothetical protein
MKKVFSFIVLALAVLSISLVALAGDMPASLGQYVGPIPGSCFLNEGVNIEMSCTTTPPTYYTWNVPLPLTTGTYSVYANLHVTGTGGAQALRCDVSSYSYQGVLVSAPPTVSVPNTSSSYQTVLLGSITVPLNGYAEATCQFSQPTQTWYSVTW